MSKSRTAFRASLAALALLVAQSRPAAAQVVPVTSDPQLTSVQGLTVDGGTVYIADTGTSVTGRIFTVPATGGSATLLYNYPGLAGSAGPLSVTKIGATLFFIDPNSGSGTGTQIHSAPANGSGPVGSIYNLGSPIVDGSELATDGTFLYAADEVRGGVYRLNPDGSGLTQLGGDRYGGFFDREHFNSVAVHNGNVYIADSGHELFLDTPP